MKVGALVLVKPAKGQPCVIISMEAQDETGILPECITLYVPHHGGALPMNKKWIEVISASR